MPQPELTAERDVLREMLHVALSLRHQLEHDLNLPLLDPPPSSQDLVIPPFTLPFPHEIFTQISALQIPNRLRESIWHSVHSRISQIQQEYAASYKRTCIESSRLGSSFAPDFKTIRRVYQASCERHYLPMMRALASFVLEEVAKYQKRVATEAKRPFNTECIPILEKYFEYNAYPSAHHQSILAEKTMLTKRQIEVWFQNHRNRAKKDDKVLRRNASDLPLRVALNALHAQIQSFSRSPSPSDDESLSENSDEGEDISQPTSCIEAFSSFRPPHAFPRPYASIGSDPFPSEEGVISFPPPVWMRRPASTCPKHGKVSTIDIDDLARMFHTKLNIFDSAQKRNLPKRSRKRSPWFAATVTVPSQAPHPALICTPLRPPSTIIPTSSSIFSFRFPMGITPKSDAFGTLFQKNNPKNRKTSSLPRRIPTIVNTAASSRNQSTSRMSSLSSDYSLHSRSSSSSSHSMTPEPSTPPEIPAWDLPAIEGMNRGILKQHGFDLSGLFGHDPDTLTASSGDINTGQIVNSVSDKHSLISAFDFNFPSPFPHQLVQTPS